MAWRTPVLSAVLTVDNFYEPFLDSSCDPIIIRPKPREVLHCIFNIDTAGATDTLDWEVLVGNRIVTGGNFDSVTTDYVLGTVTNGSDKFEISGGASHFHFSAGDGPFRFTGGDLPSGVSTGTDYWLIIESATELKIVTTLANALAGTVQAFADDGTGTQTLIHTGKGAIILGLDTVADTQADDYYNELFIHITSGLAQGTFRKIADFVSSGDVCRLLHSSDGVPAAGDTYDIYSMSQVVDGLASVTTVAATAPVEASPMQAEFGLSGYPVVIPRARASGGTDAHKVMLAYSIDGVDA